MVKIIDEVKYLSKIPTKRGEFINKNELLNTAYKKAIDAIKKRILSIDTNGQHATVKIVGNVKNKEVDVLIIDSETDDLKEKILSVRE